MKAETQEVIVLFGNELKSMFKLFSRILQESILLLPGQAHFLFYFLSRLEIEKKKQVFCRNFISKIKTRPYQVSLWSECINASSHNSSKLLLGILNHKYESHYCVQSEILYGFDICGFDLAGSEASLQGVGERRQLWSTITTLSQITEKSSSIQELCLILTI